MPNKKILVERTIKIKKDSDICSDSCDFILFNVGYNRSSFYHKCILFHKRLKDKDDKHNLIRCKACLKSEAKYFVFNDCE